MSSTLVRVQKTCIQILPFIYVINGLLFTDQTNISSKNVTRFIKKYFPRESSLCVVQTGTCEGSCLPEFPLPVTVFNADKILQDCNSQLTEHEGYVIITSASTDQSLESQTIPLLQCFSETTLTLKTKYILVIHYSEIIFANESKLYVSYFQQIWETFGIAKIAVISVPKEMLVNSEPLVVSYNPFLARAQTGFDALAKNDLTHDVRSEIINRFRNMQGHTLKAVFEIDPFQELTYKDFREKKTIGANPAVLFKHILESYLGGTIEVYAFVASRNYLTNNEMPKRVFAGISVTELVNGKADLKISTTILSNIKNPEKVENIFLDSDSHYVFIVPKPREVESWTLFKYIFQWQVSVCFGLAVLTLCGFAALFVHLQPSIHSQSANSEIVSVWKAVLTVSINKLPRSHNQRLLIAVALLPGLIVTVACAQLFALMKSKPRQRSIKTLHDLQDSNLPIYCKLQFCGNVMDIFKNSSLSKLRSSFKSEQNKKVENMFDPQILNITDRAVLYSSGLLNILKSLSESRDLLEHFEKVGESALSSPIVFNFPKGSLFYDQFVELHWRLISSGLYKIQYEFRIKDHAKKIAALSKVNGSASKSHQTDKKDTPLTYKDLEMAFFILYVGLTVSVVCFIFEILYGYIC